MGNFSRPSSVSAAGRQRNWAAGAIPGGGKRDDGQFCGARVACQGFTARSARPWASAFSAQQCTLSPLTGLGEKTSFGTGVPRPTPRAIGFRRVRGWERVGSRVRLLCGEVRARRVRRRQLPNGTVQAGCAATPLGPRTPLRGPLSAMLRHWRNHLWRRKPRRGSPAVDPRTSR